MAATFPDGFLWGCATASYQIEGAVAEDGRGPSIWDTFSHTPGKVHHGETGDRAADHYHRLDSDLDLMAELGLRSYRFSVAWPRVQPDGRGPVNERGLDFYRRLVAGLRERSIVPALTLYHWDLPQALQDSGGWASRDTAERFADYAAIVFDALDADVPLWITLNEPWVASWLGHAEGIHAPGVQDEAQALAAAHHMLLGHGLAARRLRAAADGGQAVGIALSLTNVVAGADDAAHAAAARRLDGHQNRFYLDPLFRGTYPDDMLALFSRSSDFSFVADGDLELVAAPLDFLGVNYYMTLYAEPGPADPDGGLSFRAPAGETTAMGWGIEPHGLCELLMRLRRDYTGAPLYVTESGAAFYDYPDPEGVVDDEERVRYLDAHFRAAHRAIDAGVDLRGYYVWSLLDNFEWAYGYSKRFGIVYVDYPSEARTLKRSAHWYRGVIERNGLE